MLNKFVVLALGSLSAGVLMASGSPAQAASVTYQLNCVVSGTVGSTNYDAGGGSNCASVNTSFGSITFADNASNANYLDVIIDAAGDNIHKILGFAFSYNDALFDPTKFSLFSAFRDNGATDVTSSTTLTAIENGTGIAPVNFLDLSFDLKGQAVSGSENDSFMVTLQYDGGLFNLDPSQFGFASGASGILATVHLGNYGGTPGIGGNDSIKVGAKIPPTQHVPEPSAMLGLAAIGGTLKVLRRKKDDAIA